MSNNEPLKVTPITYDQTLELLKRKGALLEMVENQTDEMCITAIKSDVNAFKFVKNQTPRVCSFAVSKRGGLLEFVKEQTEEICIEAVKDEPCSLKFVKNKLVKFAVKLLNAMVICYNMLKIRINIYAWMLSEILIMH